MAGPNLFAYCDGNPTNARDPSGLASLLGSGVISDLAALRFQFICVLRHMAQDKQYDGDRLKAAKNFVSSYNKTVSEWSKALGIAGPGPTNLIGLAPGALEDAAWALVDSVQGAGPAMAKSIFGEAVALTGAHIGLAKHYGRRLAEAKEAYMNALASAFTNAYNRALQKCLPADQNVRLPFPDAALIAGGSEGCGNLDPASPYDSTIYTIRPHAAEQLRPTVLGRTVWHPR